MNHMRRETGSRGLVAEVVYGFFSNTLDFIEGAFETTLREQQRKIFKKLGVVAIFFAGALFLLNALALFISTYLEEAVWVGYGIVGSVLVVLGLIFRKE